jgi:UDP-2,4-diacetamido-2,4,6-trideoxy-beta-L-altropyranose hydrolase
MQLIIRADANTAIGTGHVMRCLALSQCWQDEGGDILFVTACDNENLNRRIKNEGFKLIRINTAYPDPADWVEMEKVLMNRNSTLVVLDGYHFDSDYQKRIKSMGHKLLVIDDMAYLNYYFADIILNQNIGAEKIEYPCEPETKLLLGTKYALLRREFSKWRTFKRNIPPVARKILVTMGGGDHDNVTLKVLQAIGMLEIAGLEITAVVGAANPHFEQVSAFAGRSKHRVAVKEATENMAELIAWADLAVSAGGSACWEMAFMGLPILIIATAANQIGYYNKKGLANYFKLAGRHSALNSSDIASLISSLANDLTKRTQLSVNGPRLIDGYGTIRVINTICLKRVHIGPVTMEDCTLLWKWANDPVTRNQSFSTESISMTDHKLWFNAKINDPDTFMFIANNNQEKPVGVVRFNIEDDRAIISITVAPEYRGQGYSSEIIDSSTELLFSNTNIRLVNAFVKPGNIASQHAFSNAGFTKIKDAEYKGHNAMHYVKRRQQS